MILEALQNIVEKTKDTLLWQQPESLGTTQIFHIEHSSAKSDMCFLNCGGQDNTSQEFVFTPAGMFKKEDVVEVLVRKKVRASKEDHGFPRCKVALRAFNRSTQGKISAQDAQELEVMFEHSSNLKNPFYSRAFYRKFFEGAKDSLAPFPDPS